MGSGGLVPGRRARGRDLMAVAHRGREPRLRPVPPTSGRASRRSVGAGLVGSFRALLAMAEMATLALVQATSGEFSTFRRSPPKVGPRAIAVTGNVSRDEPPTRTAARLGRVFP